MLAHFVVPVGTKNDIEAVEKTKTKRGSSCFLGVDYDRAHHILYFE
jgi:hypothetical protein